MISVIICSRKKNIPKQLAQNIDRTIGIKYELIIIDNSENRYSIFEAYNIGIKRSNGDILCFIHDDVFFHTQNWGQTLELEFQKNTDFSLIGVAGAKVKTQFPTGWWDCENQYKVINIIQHEYADVIKEYHGFKNENLTEVVAIDGVFMALKSNESIAFDSTLKGFHNYDLNLSCEVNSIKKKIGVTNSILIEHFSIGVLDKSWFASTLLFHKKHYKKLNENKFSINDEIFAGKKYIDNYLRIFGKKKANRCFFLILRFSSSLNTFVILQKYFFRKLLQK